jgi:flagellar capping protein FliD
MAYHDMNGNITIDEYAAQQDIRRMAEAARILNQAEQALNKVIAETSSFQGETANALVEKSTDLKNRVSSMISNLESAQTYTRQVIAKYQRLDQQWKAALAASALK